MRCRCPPALGVKRAAVVRAVKQWGTAPALARQTRHVGWAVLLNIQGLQCRANAGFWNVGHACIGVCRHAPPGCSPSCMSGCRAAAARQQPAPACETSCTSCQACLGSAAVPACVPWHTAHQMQGRVQSAGLSVGTNRRQSSEVRCPAVTAAASKRTRRGCEPPNSVLCT